MNPRPEGTLLLRNRPLVLTLLVAIAACHANEQPSTTISGDVPDTILELTRHRLETDAPGAIAARLVHAERQTFNDGSLGCPEPGVMYTQALVAGYHVVYEIDGATYDYRVTESGNVRHCTAP